MSRKRHEKKVNTIDTLPVANWDYPRVVVHIPLERALSYSDRVLPNLWGIARQGVDAIFLPYGEVCQTINRAIQIFLETDGTHLLIMDNDHEHPVDIIQRLSRWVVGDRGVLVVGGVNFRRAAPFEPAAYFQDNGDTRFYTKDYNGWDWGAGLVEVKAMGAGCILIDRKVFEAMKAPWWAWDYSRTDDKGRNPSPDVNFCQKCSEIGIKLYVDTTTTSPHVATFAVSKENYKVYCETNVVNKEE